MCSKPLSEMRRCKNNTNCYVNKIIKMITSQARQIFLNKCKHFIGCLSHSLVTISYHFLRNITFSKFCFKFSRRLVSVSQLPFHPQVPSEKKFPLNFLEISSVQSNRSPSLNSFPNLPCSHSFPLLLLDD